MNTKKVLALKKATSQRIFYYTPALAWGIFISIGTLTPAKEIPRFLTSMNDKLIHAGIYFFAAALIFSGYIRYNTKNQVSNSFLVRVLLLLIIYGGLIELLQYYLVPGRSGDWDDFLANSIGALLSALLFFVMRKRAV